MKILLLAFALAILSCNNESAQKQVYMDSARMFLDSCEKYKALVEPSDDPVADMIHGQKFKMYEIMYRHYKGKAEGKED